MENNEMEISLFSAESEELSNEGGSHYLDVIEVKYVNSHRMKWRELFDGFDDIKIITFSSGMDFVSQLLGMFKSAEVIFGCERILSGEQNDVLAYQSLTIEKIQENKTSLNKILSRIDNGTLRFYVSRQALSHEKMYLLSSEEGRKRVVLGSANMSYNAFSGRQRENIVYFDDPEGYDCCLAVFESLKESSSDEISSKVLKVEDIRENTDMLPISETLKKEKIIYIEKAENEEETQFILDTKRLSEEYKSMLPKKEKKNTRIALTSSLINYVTHRYRDEKQKEKELRSEYPRFVIDVDKKCASLNGQNYDLSPDAESVAKDVKLFLEYMDGFKHFHGDGTGAQYRYFEFANWFFSSPFMAVMRDMAARYDANPLPYPVFGLLYGQSKAGKTTFLETLLKMMIGQKPVMAAPDFTRKGIDAMKKAVAGAPIIVDDVTQTRFNQHAIETIKNDLFGIAEHMKNYPAVVISANEDVKAVAPEIIRRTVICRVEAGLTNTEVMKNSVVKRVQKNIGTAFYREYLARMIPIVNDMLENMKDENAESPDILQASSKVICDIIKEYNSEVPSYFRELSLMDYFSEKVTGKYAIKTIKNAWDINRKSFVIDEKNNELRYDAGQTYEAERIKKELPENLEVRKTRQWLVMNLEESRRFFELPFKKNLIQRLFGL